MEYIDYCKSTLEDLGIDTGNLTDEQIELLAQPLEAPENFYCDGEISASQAESHWISKLKRSGLTTSFINSVIDKIL